MKREKIAAIILVIIILGSLLSFLIFMNYDEIFENIFKGGKTIDKGDCADVNYIIYYASNNTIFDSSYDDSNNKLGGTPLNFFISDNTSALPADEYYAYSQNPLDTVDLLYSYFIGKQEGDTITTEAIPPENAFGVKPKIGDILNLSFIYGQTFILKIIDIKENAVLSEESQQIFSNVGSTPTTIYLARQNWHYIGEVINYYPPWENESVVTGINDTKLWLYTTPDNELGENFTWKEVDPNGGVYSYPKKKSQITVLNDTTIIVEHDLEIGDNITYQTQYFPPTNFTVDNITSEKIITYFKDQTGNKTFREFDLSETIERNLTFNITHELPDSYMQILLPIMRQYNPSIIMSVHPLAGKEVIFEFDIEEIYDTSEI